MGTKEKARLLLQLDQEGESRERALDRAADCLDEIRKLAPAAIAEGISKAEIARLGRISRPTLDELLKGGGR